MALRGDAHNHTGGNQYYLPSCFVMTQRGIVDIGPTVIKVEPGVAGFMRILVSFALSLTHGLFASRKNEIKNFIKIMKYRDGQKAYWIKTSEMFKYGKKENWGSLKKELKLYCPIEHFKELNINEEGINEDGSLNLAFIEFYQTFNTTWDINFICDLLTGIHKFHIPNAAEALRYEDELERGIYDSVMNNPRYERPVITAKEEQLYG